MIDIKNIILKDRDGVKREWNEIKIKEKEDE